MCRLRSQQQQIKANQAQILKGRGKRERVNQIELLLCSESAKKTDQEWRRSGGEMEMKIESCSDVVVVLVVELVLSIQLSAHSNRWQFNKINYTLNSVFIILFWLAAAAAAVKVKVAAVIYHSPASTSLGQFKKVEFFSASSLFSYFPPSI